MSSDSHPALDHPSVREERERCPRRSRSPTNSQHTIALVFAVRNGRFL